MVGSELPLKKTTRRTKKPGNKQNSNNLHRSTERTGKPTKSVQGVNRRDDVTKLSLEMEKKEERKADLRSFNSPGGKVEPHCPTGGAKNKRTKHGRLRVCQPRVRGRAKGEVVRRFLHAVPRPLLEIWRVGGKPGQRITGKPIEEKKKGRRSCMNNKKLVVEKRGKSADFLRAGKESKS